MFSNAFSYSLLYAGACLLLIALAVYLASSGYSIQQVQPRDYSLQRCELTGQGREQLRILDAVYIEELEILPYICDSAWLAAQFSEVTFRSVHRDHLDLRVVYEAHYQLLLA